MPLIIFHVKTVAHKFYKAPHAVKKILTLRRKSRANKLSNIFIICRIANPVLYISVINIPAAATYRGNNYKIIAIWRALLSPNRV